MITKDTPIFEALQKHPEIAEILEKFGMGCVGCMGTILETMETGAKMHNVSIERLLAEVNQVIEKTKFTK